MNCHVFCVAFTCLTLSTFFFYLPFFALFPFCHFPIFIIVVPFGFGKEFNRVFIADSSTYNYPEVQELANEANRTERLRDGGCKRNQEKMKMMLLSFITFALVPYIKR